MKKSRSYLIIFLIGVLVICGGVFNLADAIKANDKSKIFIRALILFFWVAFTIIYFYLYKKEINKTRQ